MRRVVVLFLLCFFFARTVYAALEMDGGGGGSGGFCDSNPDLCNGGDNESGIGVQTGSGGFPGPIQNLYQNAQDNNGTASCGDNCTATIRPDGSLQIDNKGVVTTWKEIPIGGGGGNDPNPNDSCTPVSKSCSFPPCPNTVGSCTYAPCGYVLQETQPCCPLASPPARPKNPSPPDGSTGYSVAPTLSIVVDDWGVNADCQSNSKTLKWYGDTDKTKVANLDANVLRLTRWANAAGLIDMTTSVSGADYDTTYYWRVVACNGANNCTPSGGAGDTDDHTYDPVTGVQTSATPDGVYMFRTNPPSGWWQSQIATSLKHYARFILTRY